MKLEFLFNTEGEANAFLQGIEYLNDGSCQPLEVVAKNGLYAAQIEDEEVEDTEG